MAETDSAYVIARWSELYEPAPKAGAGGKGPLKFVQLRVHPHVWTNDYRRLLHRAGEEQMAATLGVFAKCLEMAGGEDRGPSRDGTIYGDGHKPATPAAIAEENGFPPAQVEQCMEALVAAGWITQMPRDAWDSDHGKPSPATGEGGPPSPAVDDGDRQVPAVAGNGGKVPESAGSVESGPPPPAGSGDFPPKRKPNRTGTELKENSTGTGAFESRRRDRAGPAEQRNRLTSYLATFDGDRKRWINGWLLVMAEETEIGREYSVQQHSLRAVAEWLVVRPDRNELGAKWIQLAIDKIKFVQRIRGTPQAKHQSNNPWAIWQSVIKRQKAELEAKESETEAA